MIASHLLFVAEVFGRNGFLRPRRPEGRPAPRRGRVVAAVGRWARQQSPPAPLSNHLRRDIGLDPLPRRKDWIW